MGLGEVARSSSGACFSSRGDDSGRGTFAARGPSGSPLPGRGQVPGPLMQHPVWSVGKQGYLHIDNERAEGSERLSDMPEVPWLIQLG